MSPSSSSVNQAHRYLFFTLLSIAATSEPTGISFMVCLTKLTRFQQNFHIQNDDLENNHSVVENCANRNSDTREYLQFRVRMRKNLEVFLPGTTAASEKHRPVGLPSMFITRSTLCSGGTQIFFFPDVLAYCGCQDRYPGIVLQPNFVFRKSGVFRSYFHPWKCDFWDNWFGNLVAITKQSLIVTDVTAL